MSQAPEDNNSTKSIDDPFGDDLEHLVADADGAAWDIGYMRAIINEDIVGEKLRGSYSGYAFEVANSAVKRSLALYCARVWDRASDAITLPIMTGRLPTSAELRSRREGWYLDTSFYHLIAKTEQRHLRYIDDLAEGEKDPAHVSVRALRNERLAHRILISRERKKLEEVAPLDGVTLDDLIRLSIMSVNLVGEINYLYNGLVNPYPERIARTERYCRELWRVLPVLEDVENPNIA